MSKIRYCDLRFHGERDAKAGKPIEAFYELPIERHNESWRGEYEIGYRAAKKDILKTSRTTHSKP